MEDNKNKPAGAGGGARDISDLKAKLGMKKGAGGAAVPAPTGPAAGNVPAPIPAPPGFPGAEAPAEGAAPAAAETAAEPAVDPRRDPFASSPPPAYYGYQPIPGVDDGKPAEQLNKPRPIGWIVGAVVVGFAVFGLGFGCGVAKWARGNMNKTIDQAGDIRAEVDGMSKKLNEINDAINGSEAARKGDPDVKLAGDLAGMDLKKPETTKIFKTNYYYMEDLAIDRLFNYYNDTIVLYSLIAEHGKKTENEKEAIENYVKAGAAGRDKNYAVTVDSSGPITLAHFAEIISPVCPQEGQTDCPPADLKFKFRTEPGGAPSIKPVKGPPGTTIIPLQRTPLFSQAVSGNPDLLAAQSAARRLAQIKLLAVKLIGEQKELQAALDKAGDKKRKVNEYFLF